MSHNALNDSLLLLALSVFAVGMLKHVHLPPILGYLFVGILIGPYGFNWLPYVDTIRPVAEIGVVFLLFMIGLEFSASRLLAMKGTVFGLGGAQLLISSVTGGGIVWMIGMDWKGALVVGGAMALSSTAIVAKQLSEQLEMQGRHGQLAIAILLFQDLAVAPLLIVIPILAGSDTQSLTIPLLVALGKGIFAFMVMYLIGRRFLRPFFHVIAGARSPELFTLATLLIALTAAWLTYQLGLSLVLGAFLAGIMLSETEYKQQIEIDVRPFRDVLMGIFFISVGMQFNWMILHTEWFWVGLLTAGLIVGKGAVIAGLTRLNGYEGAVSFRTGLVLGQGSEFAFAILTVAIGSGLVTTLQNQPIIAAIILSMIIAPVLIRYNHNIAEIVFRGSYKSELNMPVNVLDKACEALDGHVVICGFGHIGQNLALFLREKSIAYVALDLDHKLVREAWEAGERVFFGDSTDLNVMRQTELIRARAVAITFDDAVIAEKIIRAVRRINPDIPVVVRSHNDRHMDQLLAAGATNVIPESFEASMMLAKHVLQHLGVPSEKAVSSVEAARHSEYSRLRGFFQGEGPVEDSAAFLWHTVVLIPGSYAIGKTLGEIKLDAFDVTVASIRKGNEKNDYPTDSVKLETGNALVLQGTINTLQNAEKYLIAG